RGVTVSDFFVIALVPIAETLFSSSCFVAERRSPATARSQCSFRAFDALMTITDAEKFELRSAAVGAPLLPIHILSSIFGSFTNRVGTIVGLTFTVTSVGDA